LPDIACEHYLQIENRRSIAGRPHGLARSSGNRRRFTRNLRGLPDSHFHDFLQIDLFPLGLRPGKTTSGVSSLARLQDASALASSAFASVLNC